METISVWSIAAPISEQVGFDNTRIQFFQQVNDAISILAGHGYLNAKARNAAFFRLIDRVEQEKRLHSKLNELNFSGSNQGGINDKR